MVGRDAGGADERGLGTDRPVEFLVAAAYAIVARARKRTVVRAQDVADAEWFENIVES